MEDLKGDVILIEKDEPAIAYKWEPEYGEVRPEMQVLPYSFIDEYKKKYNLQFEVGQRLAPGVMMVKHPYLANTYVDIVNFEENMIKYKFDCMKTIAKKLGAKQVSTKISMSDCSTRDFEVEGDVGYKWVEASLDYKNSQMERLSKKYENVDTTEGEITEQTYQEAKELAAQSGLINDSDIKDLLIFAEPGSSIKNKTKHITIDISSESNRSKEIAFSLKAMKMFNLNAEIKETICKKMNLSLEIDILF